MSNEDILNITDGVRFTVDPDTLAGMLAGLEQLRGELFGRRWELVTYSKLKPLAERACRSVTGLSAAEVLLLGSYLAASARTQLLKDNPA